MDLNLGYAGKVSRNPLNKIASRFVKSILSGSGVQLQSPIPFGAAVVVNIDNSVSLWGASGAGVSSAILTNFGGIAVSEIKQSMTYGYGQNVSGNGQFEPGGPSCDVLQVGSCTVFVTEGTPTANGNVYIVTVAGTVSPVGSIVATSTPAGGTAIQLTNTRFTTGKVDPTGITEITLLTQNAA
jgi:hypothetical protein